MLCGIQCARSFVTAQARDSVHATADSHKTRSVGPELGYQTPIAGHHAGSLVVKTAALPSDSTFLHVSLFDMWISSLPAATKIEQVNHQSSTVARVTMN